MKDIFQRRHTDGQQAPEKMLHISNHQGNANQNHNDISPHTCSEWLSSKRKQITSVGKDVEKREQLCTVFVNVNWQSCYGKQYEHPSKN